MTVQQYCFPSMCMQRSLDKSMQRCASKSWTQGRKLQTIPLRSRSYSCSASSSKTPVAPAPEQGYIDIVKGRRFHCTECGKCCTGRGEVWIDTEDVTRLADRLEIQIHVFLSRYTKSYSRKPGFWLLRSQRNPSQVQYVLAWACNRRHARDATDAPLYYLSAHNSKATAPAKAHPPGCPLQDCIFLKDGLCSVHDVKPLQCVTYPWWPDLMNQADWELEKEQVCEGLDHADAKECDAVQAATQLKAATEFFASRDASRPTRKD